MQGEDDGETGVEGRRWSSKPRIEQSNTGRLEVDDIARDVRETMHHRRRHNRGVSLGAGSGTGSRAQRGASETLKRLAFKAIGITFAKFWGYP